MRLLVLLCVPLALLAQVQPPSDAKTTAISSLSAMGMAPTKADQTDSLLIGTLTIEGDAGFSGAITIKTLGNDKIRTEFQTPKGIATRITNAGKAVLLEPDKKPRVILMNNSFFERVKYIPAFSLLVDAARNSAEVIGKGKVNKATKVSVSLPLGPDTSSLDQSRLNSATEFEIDDATGLVNRVQYTNFGEKDGVSRTQIEIVYSDYRVIQGIAVPFKQQTFYDGRLFSTLELSSVQFNVGIPLSAFELPEVK